MQNDHLIAPGALVTLHDESREGLVVDFEIAGILILNINPGAFTFSHNDVAIVVCRKELMITLGTANRMRQYLLILKDAKLGWIPQWQVKCV